MSRQDFFQVITRGVGAEGVLKVAWAYWLAKEIHRPQKRDNGERYFEHCRRVALGVIEYGCYDADSIIIGLLHDAFEDSFVPPAVIEKLFGFTVEDAVHVLSKTETAFSEHDGSIRRSKKALDVYFKEIDDHPRIVVPVAKCVDRLDNLRCLTDSMKGWPRERVERYIAETHRYVLPIALSRVGHGSKLHTDLVRTIELVENLLGVNRT